MEAGKSSVSDMVLSWKACGRHGGRAGRAIGDLRTEKVPCVPPVDGTIYARNGSSSFAGAISEATNTWKPGEMALFTRRDELEISYRQGDKKKVAEFLLCHPK